MNLPPKVLLLVAVALLALLVFAAMVVILRKRWLKGKQAVDELRQQSRSMHLEQQGMADSAGEISSRRRK